LLRIWGISDYPRYLRHRARGVRVEVTYQHDQYYVVVKGRRIARLKRHRGRSAVGVGATLSEALDSAARLMQAMERHHDERLREAAL
jgi:hypothetical protein